MKIYLDNCCYNRPFDNQLLIRNKIEAEAKLYIQQQILNGYFDLAWSYMMDYENSRNPYPDRKRAIAPWKENSFIHIRENENILIRAEKYKFINIRTKDALHLSCSVEAGCDYFLTTDDKLLNKREKIEDITIISPVEFLQIIEER